MSFFRSKFLAIGLTGLLAVGLIGGASAALAAPGDRSGPVAERAHRRFEHPILVSVAAVAKSCDLSREELKTGFLAGQSINDILTAKGSDPAECEAAVLAKVDTRLQAAVDNGTITEERKVSLMEKAATGLEKLMAHIPDPANWPKPTAG